MIKLLNYMLLFVSWLFDRLIDVYDWLKSKRHALIEKELDETIKAINALDCMHVSLDADKVYFELKKEQLEEMLKE
jgi:hypothetical protein